MVLRQEAHSALLALLPRMLKLMSTEDRAVCRLVSHAWAAAPQPAAYMTKQGGGAEKLALLLHAPAFQGVRRLSLRAEPGVLRFLEQTGALPALRDLRLTGAQADQWPGLGATVSRLAPQLECLCVDGVDADMKGGLDALLDGLPRLHTLWTPNPWIGSTVRPTAVAANLRVLQVGYIPPGVDWAAHFPALEELEWLNSEMEADLSHLGQSLLELDVWNDETVRWLAAPLPSLRWLACQRQFVEALPPLPRLEALKLYDVSLRPEDGMEEDVEAVPQLAARYPHLTSLVLSDTFHDEDWDKSAAIAGMNALACLQRMLGPRIMLSIKDRAG